MSGIRRAVATILSAALYGLCFPTASLQAAAWIALIPLLLAVRRARLGEAVVLAWLWTIVAAYSLGDWFPGAVASYYGQPPLVGVAFFVGVSSFMAAPYYAAFAMSYRALARRPSALVPWLAAAAWVTAELARARYLGGNPWGLFAYSQVGLDRLTQIADVTGVYGVTFLLVAVNGAFAEVWSARSENRTQALGGLLAAGALVAAVVAYGTWRLHEGGKRAGGASVRVAMIQGNLDVGSQWREDLYGQNLDVYLRLTREALVAHRPDIVFWPEAALTFFVEDEAIYRRAIAHVLAPSGAELVVGGPRVEHHSPPAYFNSIFLLGPSGEVRAIYDKQRLVPFAERFPFPGLDFLHRRFARLREFTPGRSAPPLPTRAGPAGVTICSEAMFPEIAAERVREGARYFVDPANDTWLTPKFSAQQFDIVRMRTIEQRRYLVRASTAGPSAIVDPYGRVRVRTEFFTRAATGGTIALSDRLTPYQRVGDLFAGLCTVVTVAAAIPFARRHT